MINVSPGEDINSRNTRTFSNFSKFSVIILDDNVWSPVVASFKTERALCALAIKLQQASKDTFHDDGRVNNVTHTEEITAIGVPSGPERVKNAGLRTSGSLCSLTAAGLHRQSC